MKLNQLRDFIAMAEHGSMRAAARAVGVSGPALAKSVSQLEAELHVPLVQRSPRGVVLSDYGRALLERARLIDAEARKVVDEMAQLRGRHEGAVTVGASPTPSVTIVPDALVQFRQKYPAVRVSLLSGLYHAHVPSLRNGSMDLAVGPVPAAGLDGDLHSEPLFYNTIVVVARRGHPLARCRRLADLQHSEWIVTGPTSQGPGAAILDAFALQGLGAPSRIVQCDMTWALSVLLEKSDMLCAMPLQLIERLPLGPQLQTLALRDELPRYTIKLYWRADSPLLPGAEHFATLLRRHAFYLGRDHPKLAIC